MDLQNFQEGVKSLKCEKKDEGVNVFIHFLCMHSLVHILKACTSSGSCKAMSTFFVGNFFPNELFDHSMACGTKKTRIIRKNTAVSFGFFPTALAQFVMEIQLLKV